MNNIQKNIYSDLNTSTTDLKPWNEEIAINIAKTEGIILNTIHWEVIYFTRKFYTEFNIFPKIRILVTALEIKYGPQKGNSRYLAQLFPKGSVIQKIAKISGLPKPNICL